MTAAVRKAFVLLLAVLAEREILHRRPLAVIGHGVEDDQPRPAGRAVDEGMEIAAVRLVKEFFLTGIADGNVRRDEDIAFFPGAFDNGKGLIRRPVFAFPKDLQNSRPFRRPGLQILAESGQV